MAQRKRRRVLRHACDGQPHGIVHITGDIERHGAGELRNIIASVERREKQRDVHAAVLGIQTDSEGMHVAAESEKLAQHIADALARARKAAVVRVYSDAEKARILTCRLP